MLRAGLLLLAGAVAQCSNMKQRAVHARLHI